MTENENGILASSDVQSNTQGKPASKMELTNGIFARVASSIGEIVGRAAPENKIELMPSQPQESINQQESKNAEPRRKSHRLHRRSHCIPYGSEGLKQLGFEFKRTPSRETRLFHIDSNTMITNENLKDFIQEKHQPSFHEITLKSQETAQQILCDEGRLEWVPIQRNIRAMISRDFDGGKTLMIVPGRGKCRAGVFSSYSLLIKGMEIGTSLSFVREAKHRGMNVVLLDPNARGEEHGLETLHASLSSFRDQREVYILAHSAAGGHLVRYLRDQADSEILSRIRGICFSDGTHNIQWCKDNPHLFGFLQSPACLYLLSTHVRFEHDIASKREAGECIDTDHYWIHRFGRVRTLWAGTTDHGTMNWFGRRVIWHHFDYCCDFYHALKDRGKEKSIAMSANGTRIVIGSISRGIALLRVLDVHNWVQIGSDIVLNKHHSSSEISSYSLSISSDGLRVGAYTQTPQMEHIQVYQYEEDWVPLGSGIRRTSSDRESCFAMNAVGHRLIIGTPGEKSTVGVLDYEPSAGKWRRIGEVLLGSDFYFGSSVAISANGDRIAIGSIHNIVKVYDLGEGHWVQLGQDLMEREWLGILQSVYISPTGDRIGIVGKLTTVLDGGYGGFVKWFVLEEEKWIPLGQTLVLEDGAFYTDLVMSIDAAQMALVATTPLPEDCSDEDRGYVQAYEFQNNSSSWKTLGSSIPILSTTRSSIEMSADGQRLAIVNGTNNHSGCNVIIFDFNGREWLSTDYYALFHRSRSLSSSSSSSSEESLSASLEIRNNEAVVLLDALPSSCSSDDSEDVLFGDFKANETISMTTKSSNRISMSSSSLEDSTHTEFVVTDEIDHLDSSSTPLSCGQLAQEEQDAFYSRAWMYESEHDATAMNNTSGDSTSLERNMPGINKNVDDNEIPQKKENEKKECFPFNATSCTNKSHELLEKG